MYKNLGVLTAREAEVLDLIASEYTIKEIAGLLYISDHTVITHRKNIFVKFNARNTAGMIRRGFELNYLSINTKVAL